MGSRLTFSEAQDELARMWGIDISISTVRNITLKTGGYAHDLVESDVREIKRNMPDPLQSPSQLVMSVDGAMVQTTSGEWREVKTVAFGEFESVWDGKQKEVVTKTETLSYFSQVAPSEAFAEAALYEWHRRGGDNAERVVAVNDGALWIQSFIDYHCPDAIRVIDFAHAKGHLATIGKTVYGAETETFREWFGKMSKQLGKQPTDRTLNDLRFLRHQHRDHPEKGVLDQAVRYLEKREKMLDYPHFRKQEVPIGSGIVESGHKVVMQRRMKQAGMRWKDENLNPMLALRTILSNRRWSQQWAEIHRFAREQKRANRLSTISSSQPIVCEEVITEKDCLNLDKLAKKISSSQKQGRQWKDHAFIFPYRPKLSHRT